MCREDCIIASWVWALPTEAGAYAAPVPRGRDKRPCTRCATYNRNEQGCFRMLMEETKSDSNTGTMKTIKIAVERMNSPTAYFFVSPGCLAPVGRHSAAGPCAGASGASNSQSYNLLLQRVFACFVEGIRQSPRPCGPAPFTQGSPFYLFQREIVCQIRRVSSATGCRADGPAEGAKYLGVPRVSAACCWLGKPVTIDGEER